MTVFDSEICVRKHSKGRWKTWAMRKGGDFLLTEKDKPMRSDLSMFESNH